MPRRDTRNDDQLAQIKALVARSGRQGRARLSPLVQWLMDRHDAFAAMLREYPASWNAIADALATIGLTDGKGQAPTAERARKTWWDARKRVSAKQVDLYPPLPQLAPDKITPDVLPAQEGERASRPRPRLDIRPALPRESVPSSATSSSDARPVHAPAPQASSAREHDLEVQRILRAMDKHKPGIPKLMTGED